ncbi:MAG: lamin tail domain-containing protein [Ignavibacteriales bacterium]|nr:lamin tail domain-containing protein [Ignavibacteriales bacterium]
MQKKIIFLCAGFLAICTSYKIQAQSGTALTFSEIMFYPSETNGEFVEIYNTSTTETVDLANYKFKYSTSSNNNIVSFIGGTLLGPGKFAVILQGNYDYNNGIYKTIIPTGVIVLKISTNNFGSSGMANTTNRDVSLINSSGQIVDTYTYSANNTTGLSDEKVLLGKDNSISNWKNSIRLHGTPGNKNSVSQPDYDLQLTFSGITPEAPTAEDSVKITMLLKNLGKLTAANFSVTIFNDANNDSVSQPEELILSKNYSSLANGDSLIIQKTIFADTAGNYHFIGTVNFAQDENATNNNLFIKFTVTERPATKNEIVINEVMYAPASGEPEWIELYNKSNRVFNLKNWKIGDNTSLSTISTIDFVLNPGEYLVISNNVSISDYYEIPSKFIIKSLPTLSNTGDDVILKSNYGKTIDSLKYSSAWGGSTGSKSLERVNADDSSIDSTNWKTCKSKFRATPGKINSVVPKIFDLSIINFSSSSRYAEVGRSFTSKIIVENLGSGSVQNYSLRLYYDSNLDSLEQANELVSEKSGTIIAAGDSVEFQFTITNYIQGINQFIAKIEFAQDEYFENNTATFKINGVFINEQKGDLVVNEIMYGPASPEQEWIEIYNSSTKQINLCGYKIANHSDTAKVISGNIVLQPDEYLAIARDTLSFSKYPKIPTLLIASFPSLNNTIDKLILLDSLNRVIDSFEYKSNWGGNSGKSLERINAAVSSTDSTNWKTTESLNGATPGFVNSVSKKNYDLAITDFSSVPLSPIAGEKVLMKIDIQNAGKRILTFKIILSEIKPDGNKIQVEEFIPSTESNINPGDKISVTFNYKIEHLIDKRTFEAIIICAGDEDLNNNIYSLCISPGYTFHSVLLNEIMYNPVNGEPEWIELYNNLEFDVDLANWSITDLLTNPLKTKIESNDYIFPAKTFLVIAKDSSIVNFHRVISSKIMVSSFANLNNDADGLIIKDYRGVAIDSMKYEISWGGINGKSLERKAISASSLDKNNWGSSKDLELSTPGRINSITSKKIDLFIKAIFSQTPYPAYNEEIDLAAKVINSGTNTSGNFIVHFFLLSNNQWNYFSGGSGKNIPANDSAIVISNAKLQLNETKTVMCKILFSEDEDTLNNTFVADVIPGLKRNTILINEIMFDPATGESEWIEIVNASTDPVNLNNWQISDLLPSPTKSIITTKDVLLNPGEFAIIAYDSLRYHYFPPKKFFQAKFGSLSSMDGLLIYDFRGAVIDSVKYNSAWGCDKGFSLERISINKPTADSTNWCSSISLNCASPGIRNSVINLPKYCSGSMMINEIMFDPAAGNSEYLEFYNTSGDSVQLAGLQVKIGITDKYKLKKIHLMLPPKKYFVLASDSSVYNNYSWLKTESYSNITGSSSLSLLNDASMIVLKDFYGTTLDSLTYSSGWHSKNVITTKNRSLEKLNPEFNSDIRSNWNTSVGEFGATPGKENSIFSQNLVSESKATISPNPFSPDGDGFEDYTIINFDLTKPLSQVRIRVFDSSGRLVRTLVENRLSSSKNSLVFDGLDDNNRPLRIGIYILLIETVAEGSGNVEVIKMPIVVARKL